MAVEIIPAGQAFEIARKNPQSKYPRPGQSEERLFPVPRPVGRPSFSIARDAKIFTMGSCFAREVDKALRTLGFTVVSRDSGVDAEVERSGKDESLYNKYIVHSILNELRWALDPAAPHPGQDVLVANTYSKSVQRAAAEVFASRHANVDYFPSYEFVTLGDPKTNWAGDYRHVHPKVVNRIMTSVMASYLDDPALAVKAISDDANLLYTAQDYTALASLYAANGAALFSDIALYRAGLAFKKLGDFAKARDVFGIAAARDPGNGDVAKNLALMEQRLALGGTSSSESA